MAREKSTFVISITPFDEAERLDEAAMRGHLRRMGDAGIGVYVVGGGSGEAYTLSRDEQETILGIAAEELRGRSPVRAMGVEPRTAQQMVDFSRMVEAAGLDAMQVYSLDQGHGHRPSAEEIEQYFVDILDNVRIPVVLSTHMSVGYFLQPSLLERLVARYENIIGVNVTNMDITYLVDLVDRLPERIGLHVGGPMQAITAMALGASGYLSSEGNVAPRLCQSVVDHVQAGDHAAAHRAYGTLMRLFTLNARNGGTRATKAELSAFGQPGGFSRRPRLPVRDPELSAMLVRELEALGIPEIEGFAAVALAKI
ncbi:MAG TPA: dihydrodipicolinate synthase family protein [Candidatus Dormibacteraeota bacterium]|jgi:4-hydroxy-tetrahydrodipicolinate synthase|nr:dihydrodipicolinate synthase family protein [Candidatus Dormibacteraeota bacterium]